MQNERRRYPRVGVTCPAKVFDRNQRLLVRGRTVDVSAGGVRIMGPVVNEPKPGDEVNVEIDLLLPNTPKPKQVQRRATIRRVELMGEWTALALEFTKTVDM